MPIDSKHPQYKAREDQWKRCRDTIDGTDAIKDAGEAYLPKLSSQSDSEYAAYKLRALFYPASGRTVHGLTGAVMRKDPVVVLPESIDFQDDITSSGVSLNELAKTSIAEVLTTNRYGYLIDRSEDGSRPWMAPYAAENIYNWDFEGDKLVMLVLAEVYSEKKEDDNYELIEKTQLRELLIENGLYVVNLWRKDKKEKFSIYKTLTPTKLGRRITEIPFNFVHKDVRKPILMDLVDVNLNHYMFSADLSHGEHFVGLPTPTISGLIKSRDSVDDKIMIGSTSALILEIGGDAKFLEFTGKGLGELRDGQKDRVAMMVTLGARPIADSKGAAETAEKARIDASGDGSSLDSVTTSVSITIEKSLKMMAEWENASGEVSFELNRDFLPMLLDSQTLTSMTQAVQSGYMSHETYYENLQRGEIARPDRSFEDEKELIEQGGIIPVSNDIE